MNAAEMLAAQSILEVLAVTIGLEWGQACTPSAPPDREQRLVESPKLVESA
ncbi:MAG: hypothetical protein QXT79_09785 [Thermofilaceae archaeon]